MMLPLQLYPQQRGVGVAKRPNQSASEQRIALVIGNSAYKDSPLVNPTNDANDMAQSLAHFGFEVTLRENLSLNEMKMAIRAFGEKIRNGGVGLFYYAGHAMQVNGRNYLIPVGASINAEAEVEYETVDVGFVMAQMESAGNPLNIVILDACRNNPFARSFRSAARGLASIDAPSGTLIAYATAPGSVASDGDSRNGLYTQELLNYMRMPGFKIEDVFKRVRIAVQKSTNGKQVPWESSSLTGDFYFSGPGAINPVTDPVARKPEDIKKETSGSINDRDIGSDLSGVWVLYNADSSSRSVIYTFFHNAISGEVFYDATYSSGMGKAVNQTLSINYVGKDGRPSGKLIFQIKDKNTLVGEFIDERTSGQLELRRQGKTIGRDLSSRDNLTGIWRNLQADAASLSSDYRIFHNIQTGEVSYQAELSTGKGAFIGNKLVMVWTRRGDDLPSGLIELILINPGKLKGRYIKGGQEFELELTRR